MEMARVLVVDDEPVLLDELDEILSRAGHEVSCASNGLEALELIRARKPDLVLSDIKMPQMCGYELISTLRAAHPEMGDLPFLFLSSLTDSDQVVEGLHLGADDYIRKPFEPKELLARVGSRLRQRHRLNEIKERQFVRLYKALSSREPETWPAKSAAESATKTAFTRLVRDHSGPVPVGRFKVIDLEAVPQNQRALSELDCDRLYRLAETTIREHLSPQDLVVGNHQGSLVVCFADATEEQAVRKARDLAELISEKLRSEAPFPCPARIPAEVHTLQIGPGIGDRSEYLVEDLCRRLNQEADRAQRMSEDLLAEIAASRSLVLAPVMTTLGRYLPRVIAEVNDSLKSRVAKLSLAKGEASQVIAQIELDTLCRVASYISRCQEPQPWVIAVPVRYATLMEKEASERYFTACATLPSSVAKHLAFVIEDCPKNVFPCEKSIKSLASCSTQRVLELRDPAVDHIDAEYLQVATLSMKFDVLQSAVRKRPHLVRSFVARAHDQKLPILARHAPADARRFLNEAGIDLMSGSLTDPEAVWPGDELVTL